MGKPQPPPLINVHFCLFTATHTGILIHSADVPPPLQYGIVQE